MPQGERLISFFGAIIPNYLIFSPAYVNKYTGMMAVFDAAYYISGRNLRAVATLGFASGDENPNYDVNFFGESNVDGTYGGFIPLQEIYAGKRVRSFYVIGSKPINRLLSSPVPNAGGAGRQTKFAQRVGGFTNLVFTGGGLQWTPVDSKRRWEVRPNVLFYWVDQPSRVFTLANNLTVSDYLSIPVTDGLNALPTDFGSLGTKFARKFLGTEANLFVDFVMLDQLKFYFVSAVFMPGDYYRDVFGTPLNNADLDNLIAIRNNAGETFGTLPLLGTSTAFSVNAGLQYEF